jgi:hypothetical protein
MQMHMRQFPTLDLLRHTVRSAICPHCLSRPAGSEALGADVPRACEAGCPVFESLPVLKRAAEQIDPMLRSREMCLRHLTARLCDYRKRRAGTGAAAATQNCPLRRHAVRIARTIDSLYGQ